MTSFCHDGIFFLKMIIDDLISPRTNSWIWRMMLHRQTEHSTTLEYPNGRFLLVWLSGMVWPGVTVRYGFSPMWQCLLIVSLQCESVNGFFSVWISEWFLSGVNLWMVSLQCESVNGFSPAWICGFSPVWICEWFIYSASLWMVSLQYTLVRKWCLSSVRLMVSVVTENGF